MMLTLLIPFRTQTFPLFEEQLQIMYFMLQNSEPSTFWVRGERTKTKAMKMVSNEDRGGHATLKTERSPAWSPITMGESINS
jgi:hypothetical protein